MLYTGSDNKDRLHKFRLEQLLSNLNIMINDFLSKYLEVGVVLTTANNTATVKIPAYYSVDTIAIQVLENNGSVNLVVNNSTDNENIMNINITGQSDGIAHTNYITPNYPNPYDVTLTMNVLTGTTHKLALKIYGYKRL